MKDSKTNIHEDHRIRMRQKYLNAPDAMPDHEILEMLLFNVIPRKNTNPIAHALIKAFGSLKGVFEADTRKLVQVEGVGEKTAFFLKEIQYLWKRIETTDAAKETMDSFEKIARYFTAAFSTEVNECVYIMLLDARAHMIACKKLTEGTVTSSKADSRMIAEAAVLHGASRFVLAHNHLSGSAEPSDDDIATTRYLQRVLRGVEIYLEEHFVIAGDSYCPILAYINNQMGT